MPARATVLRFTPTLREVRLSSDDADATARQTVLPLLKAMVQWAEAPLTAPATSRRDLCATCPMAEPCRRHFPERLSVRDDAPTAGTRPRPDAQHTLSDARSFALPSFERRDNKQLETLQRYAAALGCEIEIVAVRGNKRVKVA